jgi:hypothetical protein
MEKAIRRVIKAIYLEKTLLNIKTPPSSKLYSQMRKKST